MEPTMKRIILAATFACLAAAATAQTKAPESAVAAPSANQKTILLISAIGDRFTLVRQRESTGSNVIDNFTRQVVKVPDNLLNNIVLRGLDRAVSAEEPGSKRIFMTLAAAELDGVLPQNRESVAIGKIASILEKHPDRKNWDKVYVVTPKFLLSESSGMGAKLQGLGVYIQPLTGGSFGDIESGVDIDASLTGQSDTLDPDGEGTKSKVYVAPYSYLSLYVLDAKTLRVIEKNTRHDFRKLFDPKSTALDVAKSIDLAFLVENFESLIERSVIKSVKDVEDKVRIEVGEPKAVAKQPEPKPQTK
jgi:hypothetical protein